MPASFHVSPKPTLTRPEMIVTRSGRGCQCGITFDPAGMRRRMVKMPAAFGSPSSTAALVPFGMVGGPSFQTIFAASTWIAAGGGAAATVSSARARARNSVLIGGTVHQKPLAPLRELPQLVFPLGHP